MKTNKKKKIEKKIDWHKVIALSSAGQYIQDKLNEELKLIKKFIK